MANVYMRMRRSSAPPSTDRKWGFSLNKSGVLNVTHVEPGSLAQRADMQIGDKLVEASGRQCETWDAANSAITGSGNALDLVVQRHTNTLFQNANRPWNSIKFDNERSYRQIASSTTTNTMSGTGTGTRAIMDKTHYGSGSGGGIGYGSGGGTGSGSGNYRSSSLYDDERHRSTSSTTGYGTVDYSSYSATHGLRSTPVPLPPAPIALPAAATLSPIPQARPVSVPNTMPIVVPPQVRHTAREYEKKSSTYIRNPEMCWRPYQDQLYGTRTVTLGTTTLSRRSLPPLSDLLTTSVTSSSVNYRGSSRSPAPRSLTPRYDSSRPVSVSAIPLGAPPPPPAPISPEQPSTRAIVAQFEGATRGGTDSSGWIRTRSEETHRSRAGPRVFHAQYNSPGGLYSHNARVNAYLSQTGGIFGTDPTLIEKIEEPAAAGEADPTQSATLRLIREREAEGNLQKKRPYTGTLRETGALPE